MAAKIFSTGYPTELKYFGWKFGSNNNIRILALKDHQQQILIKWTKDNLC